MKIAIPYENGEIFQHFGHCSQFKIYELIDGAVSGAEVVEAEGSGHDAAAALLNARGVAAVICGGIGDGAQQALEQTGVVLFSGVTGDADQAVEAFLRGELTPAGSNCAKEEDGGCGCGGGCGGGCSGGCSGCGGGCGGPNAGRTVRVQYRGTFDDGSQFDSSYDRGEPLEFVCGAGMMIPGFDAAVAQMTVGQEIDIHLMPEEAYGWPDPAAIFTVPVADLPGAENVSVGERVALYDNSGRPIPVRVAALENGNITFDANHEMAGKELNFHILLESVD